MGLVASKGKDNLLRLFSIGKVWGTLDSGLGAVQKCPTFSEKKCLEALLERLQFFKNFASLYHPMWPETFPPYTLASKGQCSCYPSLKNNKKNTNKVSVLYDYQPTIYYSSIQEKKHTWST